MKYFATAVQGLGSILRDEIAARLRSSPGGIEFDGRNDIVPFEARGPRFSELRVAEDAFVQISRARATEVGPLVGRLGRPQDVADAISALSGVRPVRARMSFRVIARVLSEKRFLRTDLRDEMTRHLAASHRRWRVDDPADAEFWVLETRPGWFRLGLRLSGAEMRHRTGRTIERPGALKPTVAAAMVLLSGRADGGRLLDPTCGSGTILSEATAAGWKAFGCDIDPEAILASRGNVGGAHLVRADARKLPYADGSFKAVAANLPFGKQYRVPNPRRWLRGVLDEIRRVTGDDGVLVVLVPSSRVFGDALDESEGLRVTDRHNLRLRGQPTALWKMSHSSNGG